MCGTVANHIQAELQYDPQDANRKTQLVKARDQNQGLSAAKKKSGIGPKSDDGTHPLNDTATQIFVDDRGSDLEDADSDQNDS